MVTDLIETSDQRKLSCDKLSDSSVNQRVSMVIRSNFLENLYFLGRVTIS